MQVTLPRCFHNGRVLSVDLISIKNGTFYRQHPAADAVDSAINPPLFRDLNFCLPATTQGLASKPRLRPHWAVIGKSGTDTFLEVLRGTHICIPPHARSFPYLSSDEIEKKDHKLRIPSRAIQYVGFNGGRQGGNSGIRGAYLSARYESHREETDWSVMQYLKGETELNPAEEREGKDTNTELLSRVIRDLRLEKLVTMPVSNLSNGQTRRARIARALLSKPELLLLDEPFMGLDPPTLVTLSPMLRDLAYKSSPLLLLALRPQDPIPDWITHLVVLGKNNTIALMGEKAQVLFSLHRWVDMYNSKTTEIWAAKMASEMTRLYGPPLPEVGHALTSTGIARYTAYEEAKRGMGNSKKEHFNVKGDVNRLYLAPEDVTKVKDAIGRPYDERTVQDWLTITSTVPKFVKAERSLPSQDREVIPDQSESGSSSEINPFGPPVDLESSGKPLIELNSVIIKYGDKTVLGHPPPQPGFTEPGLNMTVRCGTRLALLGPNGSGKTTLLSLLTSDHPHSYSLPIKFFGRSRLPEKGKAGLSLWEIQSRVGHSSPEVHGFFPRGLTVRQVLESTWAETYGAKPKLSAHRDSIVDAYLRWWAPELRQDQSAVISSPPVEMDEMDGDGPPGHSSSKPSAIHDAIHRSYPPFTKPLSGGSNYSFPSLAPELDSSLDWAEDGHVHSFGALPFGTQRLLLLLRAMIKEPDILILDEAFSGLSPEVREKAMCWLEHGEEVFLQRQLVGGADDDANDHLSLEETRRRGRPRKYAVRRPDPVPGRGKGRPLGSKAIPLEGNPWPSSHRHQMGSGERRWETVQVPNMRFLVEGVCNRYHLHAADFLEKDARDSRIREVMGLPLEELLASAKGSWYLCKGLSKEQALVVVSHVREEVPGIVDEWLMLPSEEEVTEQGRGVEMGRCEGRSIRTIDGWSKVWGL